MRNATTSGPDRRLARLLGTDLATTVVGVVALLSVHLFVVASPYLLLLAAMVGGAGLLMAAAFVPLRRGRARTAVAVLAVANYLVALGTTAVATFAMPILLLATMLPPVLAVPYVSRRQLRLCVAASFVVAVGVSLLGTLQDVTGFSDSLPSWLPPAVIVLFTPFMAAMVSIIALTNEMVLADSVDALRSSRSRVVAAADRERRRIERDLHDGAQQALLGVAVRLAVVRRWAGGFDPEVADDLESIRDELHRAVAQLRRLAHGVYPAALIEGGLPAALRHAVATFPGEATIDLRTERRYRPEVESAVYFCCTEALQNVSKHAGAGACVVVRLHTGVGDLRFSVTDDGRGFDPAASAPGAGLQNLVDRLGAVGGTLEVTSAIDAGTAWRASFR